MEFGEGLSRLENQLKASMFGKKPEPTPQEEFPQELRGLASMVTSYCAMAWECRAFALQLAKGELDSIDAPNSKNVMAGALKQLHAHLQHLAWQAGQIASGDYNQALDYLGALSEAFNAMREQLKNREERLQAEAQRLKQIFDSIHAPLIVTDEQGRGLFVNLAAANYSPGDTNFLVTGVLSQTPMRPGFHEVEEPSRGAWFSVSTSEILWSDGLRAFVHSLADVTSLHQKASAYKRASEYDALTGLYSRGAGLVRLERATAEASPREPVCVAIIDLDGFKSINDVYGHVSGDQALSLFANTLKQVVRKYDTLCRIGGDEFLVVLPHCSKAPAEKIFARLEKVLEDACEERNLEYRIRFSVGVWEIEDAERDAKEIIAAADKLMYERKQARRAAATAPERR